MKLCSHCRLPALVMVLVTMVHSLTSLGQNDRERKPKVIGQRELKTQEEQPLTLALADFEVKDDDGWFYPWGYSLEVMPGAGYIFTAQTVTPALDFDGTLTVLIRVFDGQHYSDVYHARVTVTNVNDAPVILMDGGSVIASQSVRVASDIRLSDVDDDMLEMAEVSLDPNSHRPGDVLSFDAAPNIIGAFNPDEGVLTFFGSASIEEYEKIFRSITFTYTAAEATPGRDSVALRFMIGDGELTSQPVGRSIIFSEDQIALDVPTGFTPNGDQVNDTWYVRPLRVADYSNAVIRVFTKSGLKVFESRGLGNEWDGRHNGVLLPADVYFYTIDFRLPSSKSAVKGIVTILR